MRFVHAVALLAVSATPALAQREPEIVIPGRPDVPVIINGVDASWGIVEGEFGLFRPGHPVTVITRPLVVSMPVTVPGYFPSSGRRPGYGRLEIIPPPNRPKPPPAPSYFRSWSSQSAPGPVTDYATYPQQYQSFMPYTSMQLQPPGSQTPPQPSPWPPARNRPKGQRPGP